MKKPLVSIVVFILVVFFSCSKQDDESVLKGDYFGQEPPGLIPELFAPGLVSTGYNDVNGCLSPDGREYFFSFWENPFSVIVTVKHVNGVWSKPEKASFTKSYPSGEPYITPDGKRLFFMSNRPPSGADFDRQKWYLWFCEKTSDGWAEARIVEFSNNNMIMYVTFAKENVIYFTGKGTRGEQDFGDIYRGRFENEDIVEVEDIGDVVNSSESDAHPFIAPDESFLIFDSKREGGFGNADLYISFKNTDGKWTKPINMGEKINSSQNEICPYMSPDGNYFFFSSAKSDLSKYVNKQLTLDEIITVISGPQNGKGLDIYWVDAKLIEKLIPLD